MEKNYKNMYDKRGFTLVELLAVIVVLAVVMLIAINSILPQIDKARKNAFGIEALSFADAAEQYVLENQLTNSDFVIAPGAEKCIKASTLIGKGLLDMDDTKYGGYVEISRNTEGLYQYTVNLYKSNGFYIEGHDGKKEVDPSNVKEDCTADVKTKEAACAASQELK